MHFYRVILDRNGLDKDYSHHAKQSDAHEAARGYHPSDWYAVVVELIDVPVDKDGVLALLRGYSIDDFDPLRMWVLTPRGALAERPPRDEVTP